MNLLVSTIIFKTGKKLFISIFAAGLDPQSRKSLNEALAQLHLARSPRIILGLRKGEEVPAWVTHILDVRDGTASTRHLFDSSSFSQSTTTDVTERAKSSTAPVLPPKYKVGGIVVDMKDVNVTYGTRKVKANSYDGSSKHFSHKSLPIFLGSQEHHLANKARRKVASPRRQWYERQVWLVVLFFLTKTDP